MKFNLNNQKKGEDMKKLIIIGMFFSLLLITPGFTKADTSKPGDIDLDGDVDIYDIVLAVSQYGLHPDDPNYNGTIVERADLAPPYGIINLYDLVTIIYHYGNK